MSNEAVAADVPPGIPARGGNPQAVIAVVLIAVFVDVLDANIVNVAIPAIQGDLGASNSAIQWSLIGYTLPFALMLITGGRLGDIFGRRRLFLFGMAGFTLASALCGVAVSPGMLITGRVVQGVMAAMMVPQVLSIISATIPPAKRGGAFALYGMIAGTANVSGPILGGLLLKADLFGLDWRPIFLVNLPVGVCASVMALRLLPESRSERPLRLDPFGVVLITCALLAVLYPLLQGRELGWPGWGWALMVAAVPVLGIFALWQRRKQAADGSPLVPPTLFRLRGFNAGLVVMLTFLTAVIGFFLILTLYLQQGLGYSPLAAGATSLPWPVGVTLAAVVVSNAGTAPKRVLVTLGAVGMVGGLLMLIGTIQLAGTSMSGWYLIPSLLVGGLGMGLVMAKATNVSLLQVPGSDAGAASGVFNAVMQAGGVVGIALIGVLFFGAVGSQASSGSEAVHSRLRSDLRAASVVGAAQDRVVGRFDACHERRMAAQEGAAVRRDCPEAPAAVPADARPEVGRALARAAEEASAHTYTDAMRRTLWWSVGLLVVVTALTALLPRGGEPSEAASSLGTAGDAGNAPGAEEGVADPVGGPAGEGADRPGNDAVQPGH
ncbi:DHA2 family efflux MFS transporter permease subunit [Streptomyces huiliensis]|uniref:DHA2 family efflux MFS transporter permease subunit n=1 Tax=Streptomyces huiliensis TaxID=2876027 RepID=UPI001CBB3BC6|nr:DHA2 family efflux MFS transporter permease subunit [Streptomyces huiliensis]MBZ4317864.1 DHA2 family efflux MFS transporter permease subunit [Streptomyces huiliensis]